ncbi:sugar phosphate nucleotidyltransferase [Lactococcus carnosus]|uniref:sugar phosphate nucleotidyltransferase n=1 Tax=Pseudolactococcus carnosus TaxID=2749961 RepID=UPI001FBAE20C|nr:sugar phosphate nucleotidyltransferase [Lactococcus carnosus]MCJ1968898.1 mannose-1-phosphate guanylyltransferase [Lactococcus carnosus]
MKLVLLSGGSGKRLWPLSNNQRSKQFIKAFKNEDEELESMVQRVWKQLADANLQKDSFIATGEGQRSLLRNQLDIEDDKIITEPSRRDTFPAIVLAASYLYSKIGASREEIMIIQPVDPFVDVAFFEKIKELDSLIRETNTSLGLVGIKPTLPSEKYGYIVPESTKSNRVKKFQEKPKREVAEKLINNGAVWNAGVFGLKIGTLVDYLEDFGFPVEYDELVKSYEKLPKNSFDYEFSEKQKSISFIQYDGYWKDLGTWNTLTEEVGDKVIGNTSVLIDSQNTHIINETDYPIAVIGVKDLVIAAGAEGIFVSTKEASPRVKEVPEHFFETIHYVEEDWGTRKKLYNTEKAHASCYEVIDNKSLEIELKDNQKLSRLSGEGIIAYRGNKVTITGINELIFVIVTEEIRE